jgi:hypothetical protein
MHHIAEPMSFWIYPQWKCNQRNNLGGIDFKLILRDQNNKIYPILLDMSNWLFIRRDINDDI